MARTKTPKPRYARSQELSALAVTLMPGGVSSPVRSFRSVGASPVLIKEAKGCRLTDVDNNSYIDYVMSYGPLMAGHAPAAVRAAVAKQMDKGSAYGCTNELEIRLAQRIATLMPQVPMVRFVNSGTEATMSALRLARAATGRDLVVKFAGCYHGHVDALLVEAGSGAMTHGTPSSAGVSSALAQTTLIAQFNDLVGLTNLFALHGPRIAAVALEAICGNMGVVLPVAGYLEGVRALCDQYGPLLIVDEVMTGFRVAPGGAQQLLKLRPDITCLGKIIGGGLPVGAYGGRAELMNQISPAGPVYQAGTLSGNPLSMAAGLATLDILAAEGAYTQLENLAVKLARGLELAAAAFHIPMVVQRCGSMLTPFFVRPGQSEVRDYQQAMQCNTTTYAAFFRSMLDAGIMLPPSQFEAWFISLAHTEIEIEQTLEAATTALGIVSQMPAAG